MPSILEAAPKEFPFSKHMQKDKDRNQANVGWTEMASSLWWMLRSIWRLICAVSYLNPFRYYKPRPNLTHTEEDLVVFSPSIWERFMVSIRSDVTIKSQLLNWAQEQIPTFKLNDFCVDWCDGVAFCALLESVCPGCCPRYDLLKPTNKVNNCRLGLKLANRFFSLPQTIIAPEEMASGSAEVEPKIRSLIQNVKWWCASKMRPLSEVDWSRGNRPVRAADGTILRLLEPCLAKGGGLIYGLINKRCKFNIFLSETRNVSIEIEIKGPNGEMCTERIKSDASKMTAKSAEPRLSHGGVRESMSKGQTLWKSFSVNFLKEKDGKKTGLMRQNRLDMDKVGRKRGIPLDYQNLSSNHFLISYVPISAGDYVVKIKWHGEQIPGSPFSVLVAGTVDLLQRKRASGSRTNQKDAPKEVSFTGAPSVIGRQDNSQESQDKLEPQLVTAAVLGHTSTVHRSLSTATPLTSAARELHRQATITRKRILRRVITNGKQEIVIHGAPAPCIEAIQESNLKASPHINQRSGSPASRRNLAFDTFSDSANNSRSESPRVPTRSPQENPNHLLENVQQKLKDVEKTEESQSEIRKPQGLAYYRSYSSGDMILPHELERPVDLDPHEHGQNAHFHFSTHDDDYKNYLCPNASIWTSESLDRADMREKLLEGGFITKMSPPPREKMESDSTLDSDSDIVSQKGMDMTVDSSDSWVSMQSQENPDRLASNMKGYHRQRQKIKKHSTLSHRSKLGDISMRHETKKGAAEAAKCVNETMSSSDIKLKSAGKIYAERMNPSSIVKKAVGKTYSDPSHTKTQWLPRLKGSIDNPSTEHDTGNLTVKILQSDSLRKKCFYISEKATNKIPSFQPSTDSMDIVESTLQAEANEEENLKNEPDNLSKEVQEDSTPNAAERKTTSPSKDLQSPKRSSKSTLSHRRLQLSTSLPTLSRSTKTYDIDPDDDADSIDEVQEVAKARSKGQRATLGALDLKCQLLEFSRIQEMNKAKTNKESRNLPGVNEDPETNGITDHEVDVSLPNVTITHSYTELGSPMNEDSEIGRTFALDIGKRRASLQRQQLYQESSSDSNADSRIHEVRQEEEENDKENHIPQIKISGSATQTSEYGRKNANLVQNGSLRPTYKNNTSFSEYKQNHRNRPKIPKSKSDQSTQVSYAEIKADTGWKCSVTPKKNLKKVYVKSARNSGENACSVGNIYSLNHLGELQSKKDETGCSNQTLNRDKNQNDGHLSSFRFTSRSSNTEHQSSIYNNANSFPKISRPKNGDKAEHAANAKPVRQSTVDTIDSGIVDEHCNQGGKSQAFRSTSQPRYIHGHRVVTRRPNRRFVSIDPKFLCPSPNGSEEEQTTAAGVNSRQPNVSIPGLVRAIQMFNRGARRSIPGDIKGHFSGGRSKIGSHRRRVMFSRRIMLHRRSSSRGSPRSSSRSQESLRSPRSAERKGFMRDPADSVEEGNSHMVFTPGMNYTSRSTDDDDDEEKNYKKAKVEQKKEDVKKWVSESSPNPNMSQNEQMRKEIETIPLRVNVEPTDVTVVHTGDIEDYEVPFEPAVSDPSFLLPPPIDQTHADSPDRPGSSLSQAGSTDDPNYSGFGVSPNVRRGLLDELNVFSNITSPVNCMSRQESLKDDMERYINHSWDIDEHKDNAQDTDDVEIQTSFSNPVTRLHDEESLAEIRSFLEKTLSPSPTLQGQMEVTDSNSDPLDPDVANIPNAQACTALGVGLSEGTVGAKNNFQVATADAGNGTLTVGINGPRSHTVSETNVTYTGDNMYDVIYDITQPGYYVITIKWSDINIPGSPFVCKVSY